jgi:hypothetical protein
MSQQVNNLQHKPQLIIKASSYQYAYNNIVMIAHIQIISPCSKGKEYQRILANIHLSNGSALVTQALQKSKEKGGK